MKDKLKLFFLLFLVASCKCEDGPLISLFSVPERVAEYYRVDLVKQNGSNITDEINPLNITYLYFGTDPDSHYSSYAFGIEIADSIFYPSAWFTYDDNSKMAVRSIGCYGYVPAPFPPFPFGPIPGLFA